MPKVRLYGTLTEVRSTFSMPLKLVTTVVADGEKKQYATSSDARARRLHR